MSLKYRFFQYIFYQYSIIWIQLAFYFLNFIIRWSILGFTFLLKSLYIYNDIKKVIQFFWIDIFKLIWNLIFPKRNTKSGKGWVSNVTFPICTVSLTIMLFKEWLSPSLKLWGLWTRPDSSESSKQKGIYRFKSTYSTTWYVRMDIS